MAVLRDRILHNSKSSFVDCEHINIHDVATGGKIEENKNRPFGVIQYCNKNRICLRGGHGSPLQCPCLSNPMDRGAWRTTVHGVTELDMTEQLKTHTRVYVCIYAWVYISTFISWGSKVTADGDCSHEIKRRLLLGVNSLEGKLWPT